MPGLSRRFAMRAVLSTLVLPAMLASVLACAPDHGVVDPAFAARYDAGVVDHFSDWCEPVNLGPMVNSAALDNGPTISRDGLTLFFASAREGGAGLPDIWVSTRESVDAPWQQAMNVTALNTERIDVGPTLSHDGHRIWFTSDRPSPFPETGSLDILTAWRADVSDPLGWEAPINIGPPVNTAQAEVGPATWGPELFFSRGVGPGTPPLPPGVIAPPLDIWVARAAGGNFAEPEPITVLNSPTFDQRPTVRFDGRELLFGSFRDGGEGQEDIYVTTRQGPGLEWSAPVPVSSINTAAREATPFLSPDGTMLYFTSDRAGGSGNVDIWVATRFIGGSGTCPVP